MFADKDQIIQVHSYDHEHKNYISSFDYFWATGTGLAANSTSIAPPEVESGDVAIFDENIQSWSVIEDHRGKKVYSIADKSESIVGYCGSINEGFTELKPNLFDTWNGLTWADQRTDAEKRAAYLDTLTPLSRRQFKLTLLENGLLTPIEEAINAITDTTLRTRMQIEYQESVTFERTSEAVIYICGLLGLNESAVDQMWERAMVL